MTSLERLEVRLYAALQSQQLIQLERTHFGIIQTLHKCMWAPCIILHSGGMATCSISLTFACNASKQESHPMSNMQEQLKAKPLKYDGDKQASKQTNTTPHVNLAGMSQPNTNPIRHDDDFAALPIATSSQQATPAASASGEGAPAGAATAGSSGLSWDKPQVLALHNYVASLLELQGGREDNPSMWQDVAAKSDLWGGCKPTASELQHIYDQVILLWPWQCKKRFFNWVVTVLSRSSAHQLACVWVKKTRADQMSRCSRHPGHVLHYHRL